MAKIRGKVRPVIERTDVKPYAWTTDKPTEPGWYWFCGRYCSSTVMEHKIMRVYDDEHGGMRIPSTDHSPDDLVGAWFGQWAGPIPEPVDQEGEQRG